MEQIYSIAVKLSQEFCEANVKQFEVLFETAKKLYMVQ